MGEGVGRTGNSVGRRFQGDHHHHPSDGGPKRTPFRVGEGRLECRPVGLNLKKYSFVENTRETKSRDQFSGMTRQRPRRVWTN